MPKSVIPAEAGIQGPGRNAGVFRLDSGFRRNDGLGVAAIFLVVTDNWG